MSMDELDRKAEELPLIPALSEYELVRELGRGGTAVVYLARDRELSRYVAIKLIRPSYVKDHDAVARLEREAHTVGRLQHPNIAMLLGTRRLGDQGLALILQYVAGETLKERVDREGPLPFDEAEQILRDLGQALAYAHRHRIVHRDLKPQNVYLDEEAGLTRLADFGIARPWDSDSALTLPGTAIGTPTYMSPEQVDGDRVDGRSDIYSLGLVGYEMLTGKEPWAGHSLYSIISKQKYETLPPLDEVRPGVPENLRAAIEKALEKEPKDRWATAEAFLSRLSEGSALPPWEPMPVALSDRGPVHVGPSESGAEKARPSGPPEGRPKKAPALAMAVAAVAVAGVLTFLSFGSFTEGWDLPGYVRTLLSESPTSEPPVSESQPMVGLVNDPWGEAVPPDPDSDPPEDDPLGSFSVPGPDLLASARLSPVEGTNRDGRPEATLPEPLTVQVSGPDGEPLSGVPVHFEVVSGAGSVGPTQTESGQDGMAFANWTLGPVGSEQRVRAFVVGRSDDAVEFRADPVPALASRLEVVGGAQQIGTPRGELPQAVSIRVWDEDGRPLSGVEISVEVASGGGQALPSTLRSNASGSADVRWVLGPDEGLQQLVASVPGRSDVRVTVTARAEPTLLPVRAGIAVGGTHSCRIGGSGDILCWGDNESGQLGDGRFASRLSPGAPVGGTGSFMMVAAGISHTCALDREGVAYCWGQNAAGQLGDGSFARRAEPSPVSGTERFVSITAGLGHTCAIREDGAAFCWGENGQGQLGDGSRVRRPVPVQVRADASFGAIAAGWNHTCGLDRAGQAHCWGGNASGEAGVEGAATIAVPSEVAAGIVFDDISAGGTHTCGLGSNGQIYCWGSNTNGQLGDGSSESRATPAPIARPELMASVSAGGVHTCALTRTGTALCWGRNHYGQLGDGTLQDRREPVRVAGTLRFSDLEAAGSHTCARTPTGGDFCWGYNIGGQLGDGSRQNRSTPARVIDPGD